MESASSEPRRDEKKSPLTHDGTNVESTDPYLRPPMATIEDDDERLLARIGYRQVSHVTSSEIAKT